MSDYPPFERAQAYLLSTISESISPRTSYKLDRMQALLRELGDPHRAYPIVHIGGTSGKTSTSTMVASILLACGRTVGLHTKPHLHSMTERARIDGIEISQERFAELFEEMRPAIERITPEYGLPTYYETLLALAFYFFAREAVDVAVIEVGLGGRLDGTNVVLPEVAAITSVGFDHTDVLGDTIEAIAREKGGIAKAGVPLIVAATDPVAIDVLASRASGGGAVRARAGCRYHAGVARRTTVGASVRGDYRVATLSRASNAAWIISTRKRCNRNRDRGALAPSVAPGPRCGTTRTVDCNDRRPYGDVSRRRSNARLRYRAQRRKSVASCAVIKRTVCRTRYFVRRCDRRK
jgi:folylpolyglutamate synthase/dihydrofolate synthase